MKKIFKATSLIAILLFFVLYILEKFHISIGFHTRDITLFLVLVYLVTNLKYFQLELRDKNAEIQDLKNKLKNN